MIKRILVAVDGSRHADKAVAMAADIASRLNADLAITHALPQGKLPPELEKLSSKPVPKMPPMSLGGASVDYQVPAAVLKDIAENLLEKAKRKATDAGVNNAATSYHGGEAAQVILDAAKAHRADLIVMGSRGLGELKGLMMGSVSHKVQQLFEGSVLTVK
ncbi:universal stress protein [Aquisalimonas sp.]|uniref:universal stress protein n=1 Tax=Aquisalimonas sp. TaxID=1872621 RepID=UPI0025BD77DC|nr:universal stress protein [Aquisalimonas sp.]